MQEPHKTRRRIDIDVEIPQVVKPKEWKIIESATDTDLASQSTVDRDEGGTHHYQWT